MRLVLLAIAASAAACGPPYYLRNNAAGALDCPEENVELHTIVAPSKHHAAEYEADGCGRSIRYRCRHVNCEAE